ncbi:MAG: sodium:proton exchanger [Deltaproteobacteria bacterium]|nr:sodium:proton exchanger [Deltaproteobacteria bacterium]
MILMAFFVFLVFLYSIMSRRLERTVFTPPIVFTTAGLLLVFFLPVLEELEADRKAFLLIAEVGLVLTLFSDATRINLRTLKNGENLPIRLLGIGMMPTILLGAVVAAIIFPHLSIWEMGVLAAILAPTDAGLGEVIVNSPRVPVRIRQALSVEAGLNDGLSVPFLMFFIALAQVGTQGAGAVLVRFVMEQLGFGTLVGLAIGLAGGLLLARAKQRGWMTEALQQLGLVALPLLCVMGSEPVGGSMFIAAYVAGLAVQVSFSDAAEQSVAFTEGWGRLLDFFVFFLFGMFVALAFKELTPALWMYASLSLTVVRMFPVAVSLMGTRLSNATVVFMGWFGPRGLASIVLGLVYLEQQSYLPGEPTIRLAVMTTVLLSIFAHGLSALPGIALYGRRIDALGTSAPEKLEREPEG